MGEELTLEGYLDYLFKKYKSVDNANLAEIVYSNIGGDRFFGLDYVDASRFYLYVDTVYLAALLISFVIYLLAPLHNSRSIISSIENNFSHHHITKGDLLGCVVLWCIDSTL